MSSAPPSCPSTPIDLDNTLPNNHSQKRSWVWLYFSDVDEEYVECHVMNKAGNPCSKKIKRDRTGSTKGMSHHLTVKHRLANPKSSAISQSTNCTLDRFVQASKTKQQLCLESLKTSLVYFISDCDLPLSITESTSFRELLQLCNPKILEILVGRAAVTCHLSSVYFFHQSHIRNILECNDQSISFTTDCWTSPNVTAFMAVTGHYLDPDFNLKSILLGLTEIEGDHSGISLANHFLQVINRYKIATKMICITTDNASVNTRMAQEISRSVPTFHADTHSIGCMAHIIHLAARDGLSALTNTNTTATPIGHRMDLSNLLDTPDGTHLQYDSIISRIAKLGSYLRQSSQRREKFITTVNLVYDGSKPTKASTLLTHVCTRWNSTYEMLQRALNLKDAFNQFCSPDNMAPFRLTPLEWEKVVVIVNFLLPLYEATLIICKEKYPTINQALPLYILQQYDVAPIEPATKAMTDKLSKYLKILLCKKPVICATFLDPRFKFKFFNTYDSTLTHFGTSPAHLRTIFEEDARLHFEEANPADNNAEIPSTTTTNCQALYDEMYPTSSIEASTLESEIERFFSEPPERKETDILLFWKSRKSMFPTLYVMARKYLSIPATSSPSERVFSGGCKILSYQQATLSSMHVEQLACVKNWARVFGPIYYSHS
ncbi:hypothetical protein O181_031714 [Austropuccinia psidii MF-1]|uniref:HAT C-terminal dimerisation domain-containing protein n=1 Tax=Austropuccinia psidii MF-1 TaxID=1389203 RepID=A0A9Q3CVF2_9BASI|nr:hypothetical protein [Austropuccinia psidii MF-1]